MTSLISRLKISAGAMVAKSARLSGKISLGEGTVVHPFAVIRADRAPIHLGHNNIVEEGALIENV